MCSCGELYWENMTQLALLNTCINADHNKPMTFSCTAVYYGETCVNFGTQWEAFRTQRPHLILYLANTIVTVDKYHFRWIVTKHSVYSQLSILVFVIVSSQTEGESSHARRRDLVSQA